METNNKTPFSMDYIGSGTYFIKNNKAEVVARVTDRALAQFIVASCNEHNGLKAVNQIQSDMLNDAQKEIEDLKNEKQLLGEVICKDGDFIKKLQSKNKELTEALKNLVGVEAWINNSELRIKVSHIIGKALLKEDNEKRETSPIIKSE